MPGRTLLGASVVALVSWCAAAPVLGADYVVKNRFAIAGDGGWDYLTWDAKGNRLFVSRGTHVQVIDPRTGKVVGDIADTPGVHGIALAEDLGKGFISNGRDDSVTVFDLRTLETVTKIRTPGGKNPDFIAYDAFSKRVFAFNGASANASVIDAVALKVVATIALDGKPEAAASDGRGRLFVDIEDKNQVTVLDTGKAAAVKSWPVAGCEEPAALAFDAASRRLFVGCHNERLVVLDAGSGAVVATLPIGRGVDAAAFDPAAQLVFSSQGDGTLTVIGSTADRYAVAQTVATQRGARTLALDPATHEIFLVTADFDEPPAGQAGARRTMKPGTFVLLVVGPAP